MTKKLSTQQRCSGDDIYSVVKALRMDPPGQTAADMKALLKVLSQDTCPTGLLMWAALCGSIDMKQKVALNPSVDFSVIEILMMDAESAPWYVLDLLNNEVVYAKLMSDLYGEVFPYTAESCFEELAYDCMTSEVIKYWEQFIPKQGPCEILQPELVRILWRFARTLNYMVAYSLDYDDEMFLVLSSAVSSLQVSSLNKNILFALLRRSQIQQRSKDIRLPPAGYDDPVDIVVDVFLRKFPEPVPFSNDVLYRK